MQQTQSADLHALIEDFFRTSFATDNPLITEAIARMLKAGGKRLRPRITLLAAQCGGQDPRAYLPLAAYMELIHVATLIHDDVVDRADKRRGVKATAAEFGNRVSVLAGDYLFAWIFKNVTRDYQAPIPHVLSATLADICDGEVLQLRSLDNLELTLDEYIEIVRKKTASLFAACAECGALAAGLAPMAVRSLRDFGMYYGIAFQMMDDVLDFTAEETALGKPVGNDVTEHKVTLPLILALRRGDGALHREVGRFYSGASSSAAGVVAAISRSGAVEAAQEYIDEYAGRAEKALSGLPPASAVSALAELARALRGPTGGKV